MCYRGTADLTPITSFAAWNLLAQQFTRPATAVVLLLYGAHLMSDLQKFFLLFAGTISVLLSANLARADPINWVNETNQLSEADFVKLVTPLSFILNAGAITPNIDGEVYESGATESANANASIQAFVGYGNAGTNPLIDTSWIWFAATWYGQVGNNDQYRAQFTAPAYNGTYAYTYRFSVDSGSTFTAADSDGAGSNAGLTFDSSQLGTMTVVNGLSVPDSADTFALLLIACGAIAFRLLLPPR